jgi:hypothetical protein
MERPTTQQWFVIAAELTIVVGIVWGELWHPGFFICVFVWVVLVAAAFLSRNPSRA